MFGSGFRGFGGGMETEEETAKEVDNNSYYQLLGCPKTATVEEIRKAFRKKAMKEHPDKGGDSQKFKKITEAYEVLSNPEKRDLYDKYGVEGVQAGGNPNGGGFQDLFSFFGGGRRKDTGPKKAKPKLMEINVTLEQIYSGAMKSVPFKRLRVCEICDGKGGKDVKTCGKCKGRRMVEKLVQLGPGMYSQTTQPCNQCQGQGEIMQEKNRCKSCAGKKVVEKEKTIEVSIEPGCPNEHDYIFTGESDEYPGVMAGDLYVRIKIQKHKVYERRGADLLFRKKITLLEALTGVNFELAKLDGKKFTVCSAPGDIINHLQIKTVKGKGMPFYKDAMAYGNLLIEFEVEFPKKGSIKPEQARALQTILGTPQQKDEKNGKPINKEVNYLEDFDESHLNKNPKGGRGRMEEEDEDDEGPRRGASAQCQQQ